MAQSPKNSTQNSSLCVGLDPIISLIPKHILEDDLQKGVLNFLMKIVDITSPYVSMYKIQKAFFDLMPSGREILKDTIHYIRNTHIDAKVVIDCKVGDVSHTLKAYTDNLFNYLKADGIVVNPYMGEEVFLLFSIFPKKLFFVLVRTSNPGGRIIQDVQIKDGQPLWLYILKELVARWEINKNIIPIISLENDPTPYFQIKEILPDEMMVFWAGFGAQGKNTHLLYHLKNPMRNRIIVGASRSILYHGVQTGTSWQDKVLENTLAAIQELKNHGL